MTVNLYILVLVAILGQRPNLRDIYEVRYMGDYANTAACIEAASVLKVDPKNVRCISKLNGAVGK